MPAPMSEQLRQDMQCESLLECFHGLKRLDKQCFRVLTQSKEPLTVDEIAEVVDRERSTAYRSIQRLLQAGFIKKEQINYDQGGYYHVYSATNPDEIANGMQRLLNDWYAKMGQLIREFEEKYAENANTQSGPESGPGSDPKKGSNSGSDPNTETEVTAER
ncbi:TrmB family transcription regulator [Haloquadratum walsbyi C23]|jgi:predicted transcriptional regulator|uniref:TrmB family transcription regulator n=2 Tax=Haloquadratum walsbyi TaxID=293091 RepID=Q18JF5_HALWD|nr:TrmB family transcription regulator [Haloquadratum walsbyi DSM 16790]CCC39771.1 TrmB family transcription regulator [Haloquadratum walsbyi C23]